MTRVLPSALVRRTGLWPRTFGLAAVSIAIAEALPSVLILPALARRQPARLRLGSVVCHWRGSAGAPAVALSFDDGPDETTPRTLDVLDDLGLRATFFLLGSQLEAYPEIGRDIVSRGHEVGTHGYTHRHHLLTSPLTIARDLERSVATHRSVLDEPPRFFRPPYGQLSLASLLAARRHALETVLWSASGREWATDSEAAALERLSVGLGPGGVVLLHDNDVSCPRGTGDLTRSLLAPLAARLESAGWRGVSVGELLEGDGARKLTAPSVVVA